MAIRRSSSSSSPAASRRSPTPIVYTRIPCCTARRSASSGVAMPKLFTPSERRIATRDFTFVADDRRAHASASPSPIAVWYSSCDAGSPSVPGTCVRSSSASTASWSAVSGHSVVA